jgi:isochorismate hydrolase
MMILLGFAPNPANPRKILWWLCCYAWRPDEFLGNFSFVKAVEATGRKKLIMAGITTDVCIVYPAITAVEEGYQVQVVVDACGSPTTLADQIALRRMENAGVTLTTTNQLIAELAQNWGSTHGSKLIGILFEVVLSKL